MSATWSGWTRVVAIVMGLITVSLGFTGIFYPVMVTGLLTVLSLIAIITLGLWSIACGISGQMMTIRSTSVYYALTEPTNGVSGQGVNELQ